MDAISETIIDFVKELKKSSIPESDYREHIEFFIQRKARKKMIPLAGQFELTPFCNFNCKMCYSRLDKTDVDCLDLLTIDQWKKLIKQAYELGMRVATLTGGECLSYSGFKDIYLYLKSLKVRTGILTNGYLIDEKMLDFFLKYPPRSIQITLYGSNDDEYEAVTGFRAFDKVYHNIVAIRDAKLPIRISVTPNRFMGKDFRSLLDLLIELGIPYGINSNLFQPRSNTGRHLENLDISDYIELYRINSQIHGQDVIPVDTCDLPKLTHDGTQEYGLKCGAGRSTFAIKYDGSMGACVSLDKFSVKPLEIGFEEAWKSINSYAINYPIPQECSGCTYLSSCYHCPAVHKDSADGHCNPYICKKTQELVRAGLYPLPITEKSESI